MSANNYATTAPLYYMLPPTHGSRLYINANADSATRRHLRNWGKEVHLIDIENVRGSEDQYTLDNTGFQYARQASNHVRFVDDKAIEAEYYPECTELIKKFTGRAEPLFSTTVSVPLLFPFALCGLVNHMGMPAIRRRRPGVASDSPQKRQPIAVVHVDQTTAASIARVHRHVPASEAPALLERRFQIINLWRPISHAALDWPLALCDCRSVDVKKDLVPVSLVYPDREGETYGVRFSEAHKWKYMRGMEPDEFVLFKCFDSVQDGSVAIFTPHTGFKDPKCPVGAPFRESIEVRALVFYDS